MTFITVATATDDGTGCIFAAGAVHNIGEHECTQYWAYCSPKGGSGLLDAIWEGSQGRTAAGMTLGDVNSALSALGECRDMIGEGKGLVEKALTSAKTSYSITQVEDTLIRFYMKRHMYETSAYEKAHTAQEMADHLKGLNIEPTGWAIRWGPYGRCRHGTRLEIYAVEEKATVEAVWVEKMGQ